MKLFFLLAYFGSCQIRFNNQRVSFATRVHKGTRDQDCKTSRFQWNKSRKEHVLPYHMGWASLLLIDDPTIYWLVTVVHKKNQSWKGTDLLVDVSQISFEWSLFYHLETIENFLYLNPSRVLFFATNQFWLSPWI